MRRRDSTHLEYDYIRLVSTLRSHISIPFAVKISIRLHLQRPLPYDGQCWRERLIVIFNRIYTARFFDLERLEIVPRLHLSQSMSCPYDCIGRRS